MIKQIVHKNNWFSIERHNIDNKKVFFFLKKKPSVFIIAKTDDGGIVFIKENRYPVRKKIWQLPAGMIDKDGELSSAKRELFEETGLIAKNWEKIGYFFVAPGHENTKIVIFAAKGFKFTKNAYRSFEEDITKIAVFSEYEIEEMIKNDDILCSISLAALHLFFLKSRRKAEENPK